MLMSNKLEEVDGSGELGLWVFPDKKIGKYAKERSGEVDTKIEAYLKSKLEDHFRTAAKPLPRKASEAILKLIDGNKYSDIFKYYKGGELYRGMAIPEATFKKLFGDLPKKKKWYKAPIDWLKNRTSMTNIDLPFSPKGKPGYRPSKDKSAGSFVSSWTWDMKSAKNFSEMRSAGGDKIPVILVADSSAAKFIDTRPLSARYEFAKDWRLEKEAIGIGDVPLKAVYVLDSSATQMNESNYMDSWRTFLRENK